MITKKVTNAMQQVGKAMRIKGRTRPAMSRQEIISAYSGVMPPSKPKAAVGPKQNVKKFR